MAAAGLNDSDEQLLAGFDMQTPGQGPAARKPVSVSSRPGSASPASWRPPQSGTTEYVRMVQATEARCARLLADAESRILEERAKGEQREMSLREDIIREQSRGGRVEHRAAELLAASREEAGRADATRQEHHSAVLQHAQRDAAERIGDRDQRIAQLEAAVAERNRELNAAERRHQDEKRELLNLRTHQLRLESSKKGQEGDLVARAMQALAEYEQAVRQSENENSQRLTEFTDAFAMDWLQRTRGFEQQKAAVEAALLEKAFAILSEHGAELEKREQSMQQRMLAACSEQSAERAANEQQVLQRVERLRLELEAERDREVAQRAALLEQSAQQRESELLRRVEEAKERLVQLAVQQQGELDAQGMAALREAMAQVGRLRENLLADLQEREGEMCADMRRQQAALQEQAEAAEARRVAEVGELRRELTAALERADRTAANLEGHLSAREGELHTKYLGELEARSQVAFEQEQAHKERTEREHYALLDELKSSHAREMRQTADEFLEKRDRDMGEALRREQELRALFDSKQARFEEAVQLRYERQLQAHQENEAALHEAVAVLRGEAEELQAQLRQLQQTHSARESELQQRCASLQRAAAGARQQVEAELQARSEQWLRSALGAEHEERAEAGEVARLRQELAGLGARHAAEMQRAEERWAQERDEIREAAARRLAEAQQHAASLESDLMDRVASMRVELHAEAKRMQQETSRRLEQERAEMQHTLQEAAVCARRERAEFEAREHDAQQARWTAVNRELQQSCDAAIAQHEELMRQRAADLDRREGEVREDKLREARKLMEERKRVDAEVGAMRSAIEAELRADFERRLDIERGQLKDELEAIRTRAADQEQSLEQSRIDLYAAVAQERAQAEEQLRQQSDEMAERLQARQREQQQARDELERRSAEELGERHRKELDEVRRRAREEADRLREELGAARAVWEKEDAQQAQRLAAELAALRAEGAAEREAALRQCGQLREAHQLELQQLARDDAEGKKRAHRLAREAEAALREQLRQQLEECRQEHRVRLEAETEALRRKELQLMKDLDASRLHIEQQARTKAQEYIDTRARGWEDLAEERRRAADIIADRLKQELAERDRELAAGSARFEEELRQRVSAALREERSKADEAAAKGLAAALAKEELQKITRELLPAHCSGEDAEKWEGRLEELRRQLEERAEGERQRHRAELEQQRQELEQWAERRITELRETSEAQLEEGRRQWSADREAMQSQLVKKDEEVARLRVALGTEAQGQLETHLAELRAGYERRQRERDEAAKERLDEANQRAAAQEQRLRAHYDGLLREAEHTHQMALEDRDRERRSREREHEQALSALRQQVDAARLSADAASPGREGAARDRLTELVQRLQQEKTQLFATLERERAAREGAERQRGLLQAELDKLSASMTQWKLEVHKQLVAKYDKLFQGVQTKARSERENFAKQMLEEEERRLARELMQREPLPEPPADPQCEERARGLLAAFARRVDKLTQLWRALETDPSERAAVTDAALQRLAALGASTERRQGAVESPQSSPPRRSPAAQPLLQRLSEAVALVSDDVCGEIRRLEAQLPLMEVITRREFVKHRIGELRGSMGPGASPGNAQRQEQEGAELLRELHRIDAQLLQDLPQYEHTYRAKLFYKNHRYLHLLQSETAAPAR